MSENVIYWAQTFLKKQHFFQQKPHLQWDFDVYDFSNFLKMAHFSGSTFTFWSVWDLNGPKSTYPIFTEHIMNRPKSSHLHHWSASPVLRQIASLWKHKANFKHLKGLWIKSTHYFSPLWENDVWSLENHKISSEQTKKLVFVPLFEP